MQGILQMPSPQPMPADSAQASLSPQASLSLQIRAGLELHRRGRLAEAAQCYQQAHTRNPRDADALALLGILARQTGQYPAAIRLAHLAVALRPQHAGFAFSLAEAYRAAGDPQQAETWCRKALSLDSRHPGSWCLLGDLAAELGQDDDAQRAWQHAAALDNHSGRPERSLGHWLCRQGKFETALESYRQGLTKAPSDALLHFALGAALAASGRKLEARAAYAEALRLRPKFPEALLNLGNLHYDEGRWLDAAVCCRKALALRPNYAKAWCNLGNALQMLGGAREASGCYERTLALDPGSVAAQHNLGNAWLARRGYRQAEQCFRQAVESDNGRAEHHNSLGNALYQQHRNAEAEACYRRALELEPAYAAAHTNLANVLLRRQAEGRNREMIAHYERALELDPASAGGHYNLGLARLRAGQFREGWQQHEWRWDFRELRLHRRHGTASQWKGEPLRRAESEDGETILLHAEQGQGDTLQFVRYAPLVAARGGRVVLEVQPRLKRLLSGLPGVSRVVARGEALPPFAWQCPLMSLPLVFGTTVDTIPRGIPYIVPDAEEADAARLRWPGGGLRVGVAWAGNPQYRSDEQRSMPLRALLPLAGIPGVSWFSLQMGAALGQMDALRDRFPLADASAASRDFAETAALAATLDLVISVDTSIAHLAGAMGLPVWIVLPHLADWRWLEDRSDCPWYPTARLFRQPAPGDWAGAVAPMADELARLAQANPASTRLPAPGYMVSGRSACAERVTGCGAGIGPG